jgi:hypothetical protein
MSDTNEPQIPALTGPGSTRTPRRVAPPQGKVEPPRSSRRNGGASQSASSVAKEFIDPETGEPFRRKSLVEANAAWNELMEESKVAGWSYQWIPVRVLNEPVDASQARAAYEGGWRPVRPSEMPREVPPNWAADTIERMGQVLYKRPTYLNIEAQQESQRMANRQVLDRFSAAEMTPRGTLPKVSEIKQTIEPLDEQARYERAAEVGELKFDEFEEL